ncbi:MAG: hypothetical protein WA058_00540, partial [Minisyncoccia bacterium]
ILSAVLLVPVLTSAQGSYNPGYVQNQTTGYNYGFISTSGGFNGLGGGLGCSGTVCGIADTILFLINGVAVPLIFAISFIVFLYGIAKAYIFSRGDEGEVKKGHQLLLWGLIGFAVMVSIWGLVNVVANTFGLSGSYAPPLPSSASPTTYPR